MRFGQRTVEEWQRLVEDSSGSVAALATTASPAVESIQIQHHESIHEFPNNYHGTSADDQRITGTTNFAPQKDHLNAFSGSHPDYVTLPAVNNNILTPDASSEKGASLAATESKPLVVPPKPAPSWAAIASKGIPKGSTKQPSSQDSQHQHHQPAKSVPPAASKNFDPVDPVDPVDPETIWKTWSESKEYIPRGLVNMGNACFMNVIIQALFACVPFRLLMIALNQAALPDACPLLQKFSRLATEIMAKPPSVTQTTAVGKAMSQKQIEKAWLDRHGLKTEYLYESGNSKASRCDALTELISRGSQEDAQEFLTHLLDALHEEAIELSKSRSSLKLPEKISSILPESSSKHSPMNGHATEQHGIFAFPGMDGAHDDSEGWEEVGKRGRGLVVRPSDFKRSLISDIFGGMLRSELRRANTKPSLTREPFMFLQLEIENPSIRGLDDALRLYFEPEALEGYTSELTSETVDARKHFMIETSPLVMILHLKRFSYSAEARLFSKIPKRITYPEELDIQPSFFANVREASLRTEKRKYRLTAVVTHHGEEIQGGHYTCDVRMVYDFSSKSEPQKLTEPVKPREMSNSKLNDSRQNDDEDSSSENEGMLLELAEKQNTIQSKPASSVVAAQGVKSAKKAAPSSSSSWISCDDSKLKFEPEENVLNRQAYLLFYCRV